MLALVDTTCDFMADVPLLLTVIASGASGDCLGLGPAPQHVKKYNLRAKRPRLHELYDPINGLNEQ